MQHGMGPGLMQRMRAWPQLLALLLCTTLSCAGAGAVAARLIMGDAGQRCADVCVQHSLACHREPALVSCSSLWEATEGATVPCHALNCSIARDGGLGPGVVVRDMRNVACVAGPWSSEACDAAADNVARACLCSVPALGRSLLAAFPPTFDAAFCATPGRCGSCTAEDQGAPLPGAPGHQRIHTRFEESERVWLQILVRARAARAPRNAAANSIRCVHAPPPRSPRCPAQSLCPTCYARRAAC